VARCHFPRWSHVGINKCVIVAGIIHIRDGSAELCVVQ